jgi:CRISPR-associated protein Csb2
MKTVQRVHLRDQSNDPGAIHYLYQPADENCPYFDVLAAAARSITHVGWGVDMVAADAAILSNEEAAELRGERWQPVEGASANTLRVPVEGTLDDLTRKHAAFLNRLTGEGFKPVPPLSAYRVVGYRRATDPAPRPYAAFELKKPIRELADLRAGQSEFRPFDTTRWAATVAGMVRHAVDVAARQAGKPREWINTFVHGHTPDGSDRATGDAADRRFAYLPLPSLERRGPRGEHVGMIRRVLVVGPPGGDRDIAWARQALSGQELYAYGEDDPIAMLSFVPNSDRNVRPYTEPAAVWSTVTPVVLPGHDDGDPAKAERLLVKALEQSGLPAELVGKLEELQWRAVGFRAGADLAGRYQLPESSVKRPRYHVRVRFPTSVRGPLAIGAGRYRGLGLFAPEPGEMATRR